MVLGSDGLYYSPIDLPQIAMQDRGLKPPEDVLACSRPLIERRPKPQNDQVLKCPRCDSLNTKFCYYNNYSLLQPRHFCKSCRRYWTKGGALRNVPVGGGCRKNKRTKQRTSEQSSSSHQSEPGSTSNTGGEGFSCNSLPESLSAGAGPGSLYYALPSGASVDGEDANLPYSRVQHQPVLRLADQTGLAASSAGLFGIQGTSHLASLPPSTLASLSNRLSHLGALPLRNGFLGVDFSAAVRPEHGNLGVHGDLNPFLETHPHLAVSSAPTTNEGLTAFSLALDSFNTMDQPGHWKVHEQQKLALQTNHDGHVGQPRVVAPLENQPVEGLRHPQLRPGLTNLSPCKKVEDTRSADWQGQEGFFEASAEANYWNNGAWADYSGYGPSASALLSGNRDGF